MTNSNVLLKIVTELFIFHYFVCCILFFILYVAAYMANKVVYILMAADDVSIQAYVLKFSSMSATARAVATEALSVYIPQKSVHENYFVH